MDICFLPVYRDHGSLSRQSAQNPLFSVHQKNQLLAPFREQPVIREISLDRCIHHGQAVAVIQLDPLSVKRHKNEIVALLVKAETDSYRCHKQGILFHIAFQEINGLHHFFSPQCHTLLRDSKLRRQGLAITGDLSPAAYHKYGTDRFISVQLFYAIGNTSGHFRQGRL